MPSAASAPGLFASLPDVGVTVCAVFVLIAMGAWFRRRGWLDEQADASLLALLVRVFIPALIVSKVLGNESLNDWRNMVIPPILAFVLVTTGFAVARMAAGLLVRRGTIEGARPVRTFTVCTGMFNYGYVSVPLVASLFGEQTLGVLFLFNVGVEAAMWGVAVPIFRGELGGGGAPAWRRLLSPPVVATVGAIALNLIGLLPGVRESVLPAIAPASRTFWIGLSYLAGAAIPIGLLLTGATIYADWHECRLRAGWQTVVTASAVRLVALPAAFMLLAAMLPVPIELKRVLIVQAAMPAAVFPIVLARHYGGDIGTALRIVVGTSLLSILTMPAWIALGLWIIS